MYENLADFFADENNLRNKKTIGRRKGGYIQSSLFFWKKQEKSVY